MGVGFVMPSNIEIYPKCHEMFVYNGRPRPVSRNQHIPKRDIIFKIFKLYLLSCFSGKYQEIPDCETFARHNLLSNAGDPVENIERALCTARKHRHTSTIIRVDTIIPTHMKKQSHPTQLPVQMIKRQWESLSLQLLFCFEHPTCVNQTCWCKKHPGWLIQFNLLWLHVSTFTTTLYSITI